MSEYIQGSEELLRQFQNMEKKVANQAMRKACKAGIQIIAQKARQLVPHRTGALEASMKIRSIPRSRRWVGSRLISALPYTSYEELGTSHSKGSPFMRDAFKQESVRAGDEAIGVLKKELNVS